MERRGIRTERGNINREIAVTNNQLRQLRARVNKVKTWLDENKANTPPTLYDVLSSILNPGGERTQYQEIADLKLAAKTLLFIQQNNISDLPTLADKVDEMHRDCNDASDRKKKTEKRVKKLDEHLTNCDTFKKNRKVREKYDALYSEYETFSKQTGLFTKSKAQKALDEANEYYDAHRAELTVYATAEKYLRGVLQKRFDPAKLPVKKWRDEREACARELAGIDTEYNVLKSGVQDAETLKRFAVKLMIPDEPQECGQQKSKSKGMEI